MGATYNYSIFDHTVMVGVDAELVRLYEENVGPFNANRAEYLAVSGGLDKFSSKEELEREINSGILDEVNTYKNKEQIIATAYKEGLIQ